MNPTQALQILDQVTSSVSGSRKDHEVIQTAISVLAELVNKCANCTNSECADKCPNQ